MSIEPPERVFAHDELPALGISEGQLRRWQDEGLLRVVFQGAYVRADRTLDLALQCEAAALLLPPHCVVVDRSAAMLHGVDVLDYAETGVVPRLEVASIRGGQATERRGILGGKRDLVPDELMTFGPLTLTTPVRTACDVACLRGRARALAALDAFRRLHGLTESDLVRQARRFRGRRGAVQLRELIPLSTNRAESIAESWTRSIIDDHGLPTPQCNRTVWVDGWGWVRLDLLYEHLRIAVEYDGEKYHSEEDDVRHDADRRAALRAAGWIVIVIRRADLAPGRRDGWLRELSDALEARVPRATGKRIYSRAPRPTTYRR